MRFSMTPEMDLFVRENYKLPCPEMAKQFNQLFNCNRTAAQMNSARKCRGLRSGRTGHFYKGQNRIPGSGAKGPTPTSFKKGLPPKNRAKVGDEVVTTDGYIRVKVAQPKQWVFKHRQVWEAEKGSIPPGMVIWFNDQNPLNCSLDNMTLIPRSLQVRYNKLRIREQPEEYQETLRLIAQLQKRAGEIRSNATEVAGEVDA